MQSNVTEIAPDIYRISTFHPDFGIQFNQFLIKDDEPFLMHTGFNKMFPVTLEAVSSIIPPADLRWIGFSHFEPDECGALNKWLEVAPQSQAVCSVVGAMVCLSDFADRGLALLLMAKSCKPVSIDFVFWQRHMCRMAGMQDSFLMRSIRHYFAQIFSFNQVIVSH